VALTLHLPIELPERESAAFCERNAIRKMWLFGSVLRDDFTDESDVDVIVEFEKGKTPGWAFFGLADELGELFQRPVDLYTPGFMRGRIRHAHLRIRCAYLWSKLILG
jgi:predicted nucleotidyltransferase